MWEAFAALNIANAAQEVGDWPRIDAMLVRLATLRAAFSDDLDIALEEAKAASNISSAALIAGDRPRGEAMLGRLSALVAQFGPDEVVQAPNGPSHTLGGILAHVKRTLGSK